MQCVQLCVNRGNVLEKLERLLDRHIEHFEYILSFVTHLEGFMVVTPALADLAGDVYVGQEMHLDPFDAVALAAFTPAAGNIERKTPRPVAAHFRFGQLREKLADRRKQAGIRGRIRPRRAADWRLIDIDNLVDKLRAAYRIERARILLRLHQQRRQRPVEDLDHQRRFPRA